MSLSPRKEVRDLVKYAKLRGFQLVRSKKHIVMQLGPCMISFSKTPSDSHAISNARRDLNRVLVQQGVTRDNP